LTQLNLASRLLQAATPFATLRQRNFGLVWSAFILGGLGAQMEAVVLSWFVLTLTDSPFLVGLATSARIAATFLALFSGAIIDRVSRQLVLSIVEFIMASLALVMLALIMTGLLAVWHIFALTFLVGLARLFQMPAAQSLAADSVTEDRVSNAMALTNTGMNLTLIIGPLLGGLLFDQFGPGGAYAAIACIYALGGVAALFVRTTRFSTSGRHESVLSTVVQGLKYVKGQQLIWAALVVAAIINLTGFPFHTSLMPIFARDVLGTGSTGLGILMSAFGIGALVGSLILASVPNLKNAGRLLIGAVVIWHLSMVVFSMSTSFYVSLAILLLTGMAFSWTLVLILTVLMRTTLPEFRGRIMGLRVLAIYAHTFGSINSGAIASALGAPMAASVNAVVGIGLVGVLALVAPKLRKS
jgi:predicted MFS family arabinose efflux permease